MVRGEVGAGAALDTTVEVETPERVRFSFRLAGPAQRGVAYAIDLLVRGTLLGVIAALALAVGFLGPEGFSGVGTGVLAFAMFALEWGYYLVCERLMNGQSIGKRALSLRVVRADGLPIGFTESLLRNLLRAADFLPFGYALGATISCLDPRFRRLGDLVASTMVIVERRQPVLPPVSIQPPVRGVELEGLPMRPPIAREELEAIELFLRRSGELNPSREEELAAIVAPKLARRMQLECRDPARFLGLIYHRTRGAGS